MTALQKIVLGTPPTAVDGDTVRTANTRMNSNVDVLNSQATLSSVAAISAPQALTAAAHLGKRVNISLTSTGTINVPAASTCPADSVILLRNLGAVVATLAITAGSGDTLALSKLNPGETALIDSDGSHAWSVLMRGRTNSDNEIVNGNCTVNGNETVGGTLSVTGNLNTAGSVEVGSTTAAAAANVDLHSSGSANDYDARISSTGGTSGTNGVGSLVYTAGSHAFNARPLFGLNTPWDGGNLVGPLTAADNLASLGNKATARTNLSIGRTLIQTQTLVSGAGFCIFAVPGGYDNYEVEFDGVNVATNTANLLMRLGPDTSNWIAATNNSYFYSFIGSPANTTTTTTGANNTDSTVLFTGLSSTVKIRRALDNARYKYLMWDLCSMTSTGAFYGVHGSGVVLSGFVLGGILLIPSSGNFLSGKVSLYGVNN
jgi:hypothetical protein